MKTRLVNYREDEIDLVFPLNTRHATIGRAADNTIQLPDDMVSKHHAVLLQTGDTWTIEDLQSRNGVLVNGERMAKAELKDGDRVNIGPYEFYFESSAPSHDWVPSHIIDVSTHIGDQTTIQKRPTEPS